MKQTTNTTNSVEKEIGKKISKYFEKLCVKYGQAFMALEGIFIVDNKIIKISNIGGNW